MPETAVLRRMGPVLAALLAVGAAVLALLVVPTPSARAETLFSDNFEDGNLDGWTRSGGSWSVISDGSRVARQASTSAEFDDVVVETLPSQPPTSTTTTTTTTATTTTTTPAPVPPGLVGWAREAGATTGGEGGQLVDVHTESEFLAVVETSTRQVIRIIGMIPIDGMVEVGSNKTIMGVGANSGFTGGGLTLEQGSSNVIIRNLNFRGSGDDAINVERGANHVWIDHNDLSAANDGLVDIKRGADFITVSWNRTHEHVKDMLLGHDDDNGAQDRGHLRATYHHNWYDGTAERHPRVRFGNPVHVFNNYVANADYGVASTVEAGVLVENNYFENIPRPLAVGVFESPPGSLVQRGNVFVNCGPPEQAGSVNAVPYGYTLDPGANVKSIVMAGAGTGKV